MLLLLLRNASAVFVSGHRRLASTNTTWFKVLAIPLRLMEGFGRTAASPTSTVSCSLRRQAIRPTICPSCSATTIKALESDFKVERYQSSNPSSKAGMPTEAGKAVRRRIITLCKSFVIAGRRMMPSNFKPCDVMSSAAAGWSSGGPMWSRLNVASGSRDCRPEGTPSASACEANRDNRSACWAVVRGANGLDGQTSVAPRQRTRRCVTH